MKSHNPPAHAADLSVIDAAHALRCGELTAVELLEAQLDRIAQRNGGEPSFDGDEQSINAWARGYPQRGRQQAIAADQRLKTEAESAPAPCRNPWGAKDHFPVAQLHVTASSRVVDQ